MKKAKFIFLMRLLKSIKRPRKIDSRQYELSEAEKKDLTTRAQNSSASIIGQKKEESKMTSTGTSLTPALGENMQNDCAALFKAYYESQICFAPYKNANGTMKPGAFEHCKQVEDPTPKCRPIKTSPLSPYLTRKTAECGQRSDLYS